MTYFASLDSQSTIMLASLKIRLIKGSQLIKIRCVRGPMCVQIQTGYNLVHYVPKLGQSLHAWKNPRRFYHLFPVYTLR